MNKIQFLTILLLFGSCQSNTNQQEDATTETPESTNSPALETNSFAADDYLVGLNFINDYIENLNDPEGLPYTDWIESSDLVTDSFRQSLEDLIASAEAEDPEMGLDYDPILNAQDFPEEGMVLVEFDPPSGYVITQGKNSPGFFISVKLVNQNGNVLVDGCGAINIPEEMY